MSNDNDIDFRQAMRDVRPLKKNSIKPGPDKRHSTHQLRAQIQQRAIHSAASLDNADAGAEADPRSGRGNTEGDNSVFFLRHGLQKKVLRDLRRGSRYPVGEILDLHGLTQTKAQAVIDAALNRSVNSGIRCLLIIHGKGLRSARGATLKIFTARYLKTRAVVQAYCSAQARDGGTGAIYVLLKSNQGLAADSLTGC